MKHRFALVAALLAALFSGGALAADGEPAAGPARKVGWVWVELDAAGQVTDVVQDPGEVPLIAGVLEQHARRLQFAPASVDGVAVASGAPLELTVEFVPVAGGYRPDLVMARLPVVRSQRTPPRYPGNAATAGVGGYVRVGYTVDAGGALLPGSVSVLDRGFFGDRGGRDEGKRTALVDAALAVVPHWTHRPVRIGDQALSFRLATTVSFLPPDVRRLAGALAERLGEDPPPAIVEPGRVPPRLLGEFAAGPAAGEGVEVQSTRVGRGGSP
ncbi:hypothetical protein [Arenimonas composti]|uniref:TonB C-terminal domain-containing protein n=1 Tax=Arenimonas composti TR7-09 = DSM 18010 TaxID=1121013 RepID=A0A091BEU6_9GAMM|nr:hypothetical protein [Arenimonas composti]KFN50266.1 hypothetical protein P873_07870 [Arenimonas composti TR7-09 = DSM 18010]